MAILGLGAAGIIIILGPGLPGGGKNPNSNPTSTASEATALAAGSATAPPVRDVFVPIGTAENDDDAILTIVAYGMPARISAAPKDPSASMGSTVREVCIPETQFPKPCITDYRVKKGTEVVITAGDSLAGYWPELESVEGGGCNITPGDKDVSCTLTLVGDVEVVAKYSGGENPGLWHYVYPTCPTQRGNSPPSWAKLCP